MMETEDKSNAAEQLQNAMLTTITELIEFRDSETGSHIDRTQKYIRLLITEMIANNLYTETVKEWNAELIVQAAGLHDIGKIGIPDKILSKPAKLTPAEFEIMKTHAQQGKHAIDNILEKVEGNELLYQAALMAYTHHERWDGTGYPQGLKGEDIPLQGRLMALADVYDALISIRPYKPAYTHEKAIKTIAAGKGTQFDPVLADLFIKIENEIRNISKESRYEHNPQQKL